MKSINAYNGANLSSQGFWSYWRSACRLAWLQAKPRVWGRVTAFIEAIVAVGITARVGDGFKETSPWVYLGMFAAVFFSWAATNFLWELVHAPPRMHTEQVGKVRSLGQRIEEESAAISLRIKAKTRRLLDASKAHAHGASEESRERFFGIALELRDLLDQQDAPDPDLLTLCKAAQKRPAAGGDFWNLLGPLAQKLEEKLAVSKDDS